MSFPFADPFISILIASKSNTSSAHDYIFTVWWMKADYLLITPKSMQIPFASVYIVSFTFSDDWSWIQCVIFNVREIFHLVNCVQIIDSFCRQVFKIWRTHIYRPVKLQSIPRSHKAHKTIWTVFERKPKTKTKTKTTKKKKNSLRV